MSLAMQPELEEALIKELADEIELDLLWIRFDKTTRQQEREFRPVLRNQFTKQKDEVLSNVAKSPPVETLSGTPAEIYTPWLFDEAGWAVLMERAAKPFIETSMTEGAIAQIRDINNALNISLDLSFNVNDPNVVTIINDKLHKFSFEVNDETLKLLKKEFREAIADGDTIRNVEKRVEKVFRFNSRVRTERIARTEIVGAHNAGNFEAMVNTGVVDEKEWIETRDGKTREAHQRGGGGVGGERVPVKEPYSNGLMFPGDWSGPAAEVIN